MSTPIQFDFNQDPEAIVAVMDETRKQGLAQRSQLSRYRRLPTLLFIGGLAMFALDYFIGYNFFTCSLLGVVMIGAALVSRYLLRRQPYAPNFGRNYDLVRNLIYTIRDDIAPKRTLMGTLDLSGSVNETKRYRQKKSASGRPISYYRDEWLRLKGKLYDGNVLRLSLINKEKVREGFYKRSAISGKRKWKSGSSQSVYQAAIAISANPELYVVPFVDLNGAIVPETVFRIIHSAVGNGRVTLKIASDKQYSTDDLLKALKYAYALMERA